MGMGMNHPGMNGDKFAEYVRQTRKTATQNDIDNFFDAWHDAYGGYFNWSTPWKSNMTITQIIKKVEVLMISFGTTPDMAKKICNSFKKWYNSYYV